MSFCGTITQGADFSCDDPLQAGVEPQVILINLSDIFSYVVVDNKITDINLYGGKQAYLFEGMKQSVRPETERADAGLSTGFTHQIAFQIFDISSEQKEQLLKMAVGKLVGIINNMPVPGNEDGYFEVFGIGAGMEAIKLTRINRDAETQASFSIILNTGEHVRESKLPYNFFDTDYQTTKDKILDLLTPSAGFPYTFPFVLS